MTSSAARAAGILALLLTVAVGATACTASAPDEPAAETASARPSASPEASGSPVTEDSFAEREAFFDRQGRPVEGQLPTAQTPEQEEFLAQQRAFVESQGGQWDEFYDGIALAVTLDACETSILNGHDVTAATAQAHIDSSPLIAQISAGDAAAVKGLVSIMVFGTSFVCPSDSPQWEAAYTELYG